MENRSVNQWVLEDPKMNDPRSHLDIIISTSAMGNVQSITYKDYTAYVILKEIYEELDQKLKIDKP